MRNFLLSLLAVIIMGTILLSVYLTPNDLAKCSARPSLKPGCHAADAIIAVSGGNTQVRTAEAIRLYQNGWAKTVIFSGAAKDESGPSNAAVMKQQAVKAGVPVSAILVEPLSRTTRQNAEKAKELLSERGITRVIVVTSAYHQRRASLEFRSYLGESVAILNHPASKDPDWPALWWLTPRGWWLGGGEIVKIIAFYSGQSQ